MRVRKAKFHMPVTCIGHRWSDGRNVASWVIGMLCRFLVLSIFQFLGWAPVWRFGPGLRLVAFSQRCSLTAAKAKSLSLPFNTFAENLEGEERQWSKRCPFESCPFLRVGYEEQNVCIRKYWKVQERIGKYRNV